MALKKWILCSLYCTFSIAYADSFDQDLLTAMQAYQTPVFGYAIIDHGHIVRAAND